MTRAKEGTGVGSGIALFIRRSIAEEIRLQVRTAAKTHRVIPAARNAGEIAHAYPGCHLTEAEIADQIVIEAIRAGAEVDMEGARPSQAA